MRRPVYLDYNSTTPLDPRVFEAMTPYFLEEVGNAGSRTHVFGQRAKEAVDRARQQVASLLGVQSNDIIFTSGATEGDNLAILGLARHGLATGRRHVLASAIEHKAVLEPVDQLRQLEFEVELIPVTEGGFVDPDEVHRRLRDDTLLVCVMHANNEAGVLQPVAEIAKLLERSDALFMVDAAQTFGKEVEALRVLRYDLLAISGHKVYGPKGIGALCDRRTKSRKRPLSPIQFGGGQEMGFRPGTLAVPLVVGLGEAAELAGREHVQRKDHARRLREGLVRALQQVEHVINGDPARTMPHTLNVSFPGVDSEALMMAVREVVAVSNGAACTSASYEPSHVLQAMGLGEDRITSAIRFSWGPGVTEIPADPIVRAVRALR